MHVFLASYPTRVQLLTTAGTGSPYFYMNTYSHFYNCRILTWGFAPIYAYFQCIQKYLRLSLLYKDGGGGRVIQLPCIKVARQLQQCQAGTGVA